MTGFEVRFKAADEPKLFEGDAGYAEGSVRIGTE